MPPCVKNKAGLLRLFSLVLALLSSQAVRVPDVLSGSVHADRDLIGWLGETDTQSGDDRGMVVLSWHPKVFLFKGLLTEAECDDLIVKATPKLERSEVSDSVTGEGKLDEVRTSSGMFFNRGENELVKRIEERLAKWVMVPAENGEGIQVLKYEKSQKYSPHHDYFSFEGADDNGGNRLVTVLMYLSNVEEGGETVFPKIPAPANQTKAAGFSDCALQGLAVKPRKGWAVAFWSINNDGRFEPGSLHGSCPVIKGIKYSATKWIHVGHYALGSEIPKKVTRIKYVPPPPPAAAGCVDKNSLCSHWAEAGECESNAGYMVGSKRNPGACLLACNRCDLGPNA